MLSSLCISSHMAATMSLRLHALLQCDLAPPLSLNKSSSFFPSPHQEVVSHSPLLESGLPYDSLKTKRMWQSGSVWHLRLAPTSFSREVCFRGIHLPETIMLKGTQRNPAFPLSPGKCPTCGWGAIFEVDAPAPAHVWVTQPFQSSQLMPRPRSKTSHPWCVLSKLLIQRIHDHNKMVYCSTAVSLR